MEQTDKGKSELAPAHRDLESTPLAWDAYQRRFTVPEKAIWWRVFRKAPRGRHAKPVNTATGPLHVPIDADFQAVADAVGHMPGWYVLRATDSNFALIVKVPAAHVEVVSDLRDHDRPLDPEPVDSTTLAIQRLAATIEQSLLASAQREQAMLAAFTEMAANVYAGFAQLQQSTTEMLTAVQSGYDMASGASMERRPLTPEVPGAMPQKGILDFLCSPAGNTAIGALGSVLYPPADEE